MILSNDKPRFFFRGRVWFSVAALAVLVLGLVLWSHSRTLSPYKDVDLYLEAYKNLEPGDHEGFSKLRDESLTFKYQYHDYGISLAAVGFLGLLVSLRNSFLLRSPPAFVILVIITLLLPLLNSGGYVFFLLVAWKRGEIPHWADNIGLEFILVPPLFASEFIWSITHFFVLNGADHPSTSLRLAFSFKTCWWFLVLAMYCAVLATLALAFGCYWFAIPNLCWLYYYLSLSAVYRVEYGAAMGGDEQK
jgi:hypothetical protein